VRRVNAEAAAITRRAASEEQRASADLLLRFLPVAVFGALAAGLALDFYLHESPTHIRRRMLRTLRTTTKGVTKDAPVVNVFSCLLQLLSRRS
jgi:hypothetical protein